MNTDRRGFLKGLAGLVASPLLLSALPIGPAAAQPASSEPLIWTPEGTETNLLTSVPYDDTGRRMGHRITTPVPKSRYLRISVEDDQGNTILTYGVAHGGGLYWRANPGEGILSGDGTMLMELSAVTRKP